MLKDHNSPLPYDEAQMSYKYAEQAHRGSTNLYPEINDL